jgi:hypothetical protein
MFNYMYDKYKYIKFLTLFEIYGEFLLLRNKFIITDYDMLVL